MTQQTGISLPSIQSLLIETSVNGHSLSTGTGFVCQTSKGPVLMTNRHNVTGRSQVDDQPLSRTGGIPDAMKIMHNSARGLGTWRWATESLAGAPWIEHPVHGAKADFVALPLTDLDEVQLYPYDVLADLDVMVQPSDAISVVGFPFGLQAGGSLAIWATGFLASEPDIDFRDLPLLLVDCRTRQGQSGSAVIFHSNGGLIRKPGGPNVITSGQTTRLLGIYSGRINEESDLGLVWKARAIRELLDSI